MYKLTDSVEPRFLWAEDPEGGETGGGADVMLDGEANGVGDSEAATGEGVGRGRRGATGGIRGRWSGWGWETGVNPEGRGTAGGQL